ncbi:MAG: excinuclease ABC subunit UvrB [Candidatus Woesearchaeota archaeon]
MPNKFVLKAPFKPTGDQPDAIKKLTEGLKKGFPCQTLLGVTGSGKTFTMANVIKEYGKPTIVIAHNKTLAAQLYAELKEFFPDNAVEYFVSYYDYYQPESYLPSSDTYIEKDSSVNPKIEQMRLSATTSLMTRNDVIIVASISCIYGLGDPKSYKSVACKIQKGEKITRQQLLSKFLHMQYERNDKELLPGRFRVKGDVIDIIPGYSENVIRIELFGNEIDKIYELDVKNMIKKHDYPSFVMFPARHFVIDTDDVDSILNNIRSELNDRLPKMPELEAHRLKQRTNYDLELIKELGFCNGIENYSRYFDKRKEGQPPHCLLDYFPDDFLMIIDESHQTIPQSTGMYKGDYSRKKSLIDFGFRLPSAFDNRPLKFEEFEKYFNHALFVSATPAQYEFDHSKQVAEQLIRPTGLLDPNVEVRITKGQIDDLQLEVEKEVKENRRTIVTTLTKKMAEQLTEYLAQRNIRVRYLHSEIDTLERTEILRQLRAKEFDVLVGINLLREGIDLPEVGLVAILDADKEGFLRNERSLIQTIGRAARNEKGRVIMYADVTTDSMKRAISETNRRRKIQEEYNIKHNITPKTIIKAIPEKKIELRDIKHIAKSDIPKMISKLEKEMNRASEELNFELAIELRERIKMLKSRIKSS